MSRTRQTGVYLPDDMPEGGGDYSDFLTGDLDADRKRVSILLQTLAHVNSGIGLEGVMNIVVDKSIEVTGAERAIVMLYDEDTVLRVTMARDSTGQSLGENVTYSQSVAMRVAKEGRAICVIDTANTEEISLGQSILDLKLLTVMCVPLKVKNRMIGLLYVDSKASSKEFKERDLTLFKALAGQVAVAIDNSRLVGHYVEKQRIQEGLNVARDIQKSLLPRGGLRLPGLELYGVSVACEETSGDYFDYIRRPGGRMGFVVGDVSGHGIGAALVMSTARALLRSRMRSQATPAEILTQVNELLCEDVETGRFMTMFYGEMAVEERALTYVRAGHNEPLVYRGAHDDFLELSEGGIALGVIDDFAFENAGPIQLEKGDLLFLYTDGIIEAMNARQEHFGIDRVKDLLRQHKAEPARAIVEAVQVAAQDFIGTDERQDDLTLVLGKVT